MASYRLSDGGVLRGLLSPDLREPRAREKRDEATIIRGPEPVVCDAKSHEMTAAATA